MASLFKRHEAQPVPPSVAEPPQDLAPPSVPEAAASVPEASVPEAPAEVLGAPAGIEGYIDLIDGDRVVGWAYDAASPGRRLLIEISAGDTVDVVLANLERHDLRDAGKGDGRHGFEAKLDLVATGAEAVHVKVAATGRELGGSPVRTELVQLVARADGGKVLECLKSEAQLALMSLKGVKKR